MHKVDLDAGQVRQILPNVTHERREHITHHSWSEGDERERQI